MDLTKVKRYTAFGGKMWDVEGKHQVILQGDPLFVRLSDIEALAAGEGVTLTEAQILDCLAEANAFEKVMTYESGPYETTTPTMACLRFVEAITRRITTPTDSTKP